MPVDSIQPTNNLRQSQLLQVTLDSLRQQMAVQDQKNRSAGSSASVSTAKAPGSSSSVSGQIASASKTPALPGSFQLSTSQIYRLFRLYGLQTMTYDNLLQISVVRLSSEERGFVNFLRKNPHIFKLISSFDDQPQSLSAKDIRLAAELFGNTLFISSNDLQYLQRLHQQTVENQRWQQSQTQIQTQQADLNAHAYAAAETRRTEINRQAPSIEQLEALLRRLTENTAIQEQIRQEELRRNQFRQLTPTTSTPAQPAHLTYRMLMALQGDELGLSLQEQQQLAFLRSPAVAGLLRQIAAAHNNFITVDVLRILSSLLYNPMLYGSLPIMFYRRPGLPTTPFAVAPTQATEGVENIYEDIDPLDPLARPRYRIKAADIRAICHKLSSDGTVTLKQLRNYQPTNRQEAKAMNLLRQNHIFHQLADLDHQGETLSDEDIRLAVAEKALILSDSSMVLVILPENEG